jgi:hypothetical protein
VGPWWAAGVDAVALGSRLDDGEMVGFRQLLIAFDRAKTARRPGV